MAWEWSHTQEAYDNARENIYSLSDDIKKTVWSEIKTFELCIKQENILREFLFEDLVEESVINNSDYFNKETFDRIREYADNLPIEDIAEEIWQFASKYRLCTNGGHEAYISPYNTFKVSFDRLEFIYEY